MIAEWLIGITFQLLASFFSNLGLNVQKYAHTVKDRMLPGDPRKDKPYYTLPVWIMGFICFCFGECLAGCALGYATQALCAVLSSYSLILNAIFSYMFTGTKVSRNYIQSCCFIIIGSIIVIFSSSHHEQHFRLKDLAKLFRSTPFVLFLILVLCILCVLFLLRTILPHNPTLLTAIAAGMASFSVLLGKCTMGLVKSSFLAPIKVIIDDNGLKHFLTKNEFMISPYPYIIIILFALFAGSNVHFMNLALQHSTTNQVYPLYYTFSTILIIINGMLFFQEYKWFTQTQFVTFLIGVAFCLYGLTKLGEDSNTSVLHTEYGEYDNIRQYDPDDVTINDALYKIQNQHRTLSAEEEKTQLGAWEYKYNNNNNNNNNTQNGNSKDFKVHDNHFNTYQQMDAHTVTTTTTTSPLLTSQQHIAIPVDKQLAAKQLEYDYS